MGGPAQAPIFSPGEVVSARYRISTYLGQGAAGEVYGAEDLHLRSRVALKVLRPGASRDPQSIERFKREILLARRVSHPNVCRIFDLGIHEVRGDGEGSWQSLLFLTMEWLEGETLSRRIQEAGGFDEGPQGVALDSQGRARRQQAQRGGDGPRTRAGPARRGPLRFRLFMGASPPSTHIVLASFSLCWRGPVSSHATMGAATSTPPPGP